MYKNNVEELCRPIILYMCELWSFKVREIEPNEDKIINDINLMLNEIKDKCYSNPMLAQDFSYIQKPLIFFIDYTIKEGNFSFSKKWKNLSRKYEELSGDDKFFDMLDLNLNDPMGDNRLELFYLFMGLGFSGRYKNDINEIEHRMKQCIVKMPHGVNINTDKITPIDVDLMPKPTKNRQIIPAYIIAFIVLIVALGVNYYVFDENIKPVENTIINAVNLADKNFESMNNAEE